MVRINWTKLAVEDLKSIFDYIENPPFKIINLIIALAPKKEWFKISAIVDTKEFRIIYNRL